MPFKTTATSAECPVCDKTVFAAEEKLAGGYKWHKICFKCCKNVKFKDHIFCEISDFFPENAQQNFEFFADIWCKIQITVHFWLEKIAAKNSNFCWPFS